MGRRNFLCSLQTQAQRDSEGLEGRQSRAGLQNCGQGLRGQGLAGGEGMFGPSVRLPHCGVPSFWSQGRQAGRAHPPSTHPLTAIPPPPRP